MDIRPSQLDDPDYAHFAWGRYKRLMVWMVLFSTITTALALGALRLSMGELPLVMSLFAAGGVFFSVLLCAALMGLVFLSSGSGHDEAIVDPFEGEEP